MDIIYAREPLQNITGKSVFLAGPMPRTPEVISWRKEAIRLFEEMNIELTLFVPEDRNGIWDETINWEDQVEWEESALNKADCILFWIPRDLKALPGFTTNVEFGAWKESGKVVLGFPPHAPKMDYLDYYARKLSIPVSSNLSETVSQACQKII